MKYLILVGLFLLIFLSGCNNLYLAEKATLQTEECLSLLDECQTVRFNDLHEKKTRIFDNSEYNCTIYDSFTICEVRIK